MDASEQYAPYDDMNPWRLDTLMNDVEWKEVRRWYPFSLRSLLRDGRWYEHARSGRREKAYDLMRAVAAGRPGDLFVIVQWTLVGEDGREKPVVFQGGNEQTILHERLARLRGERPR